MDTKNFTELQKMAADWEQEAKILESSNTEALRTAGSIYYACAKALRSAALSYKASAAQQKSPPKSSSKDQKAVKAIRDLFETEEEVILSKNDFEIMLEGGKKGSK